jgi:hypothetical protein
VTIKKKIRKEKRNEKKEEIEINEKFISEVSSQLISRTQIDMEVLTTLDTEINKSLHLLKTFILNIDLHKYQEISFSSEDGDALTQLIKQNFLTDSKIFIIGRILHLLK